MKKLVQKVAEHIDLVWLLPLFLVVAMFMLAAAPFIMIQEYYFKKNYQLYLERMNGACFFCYNSRKSSVEFAKEVLVPELGPAVQVVFVDGNKVECGSDSQFISRMLYNVKERKGFPYLMKIVDMQVLDESVNHQFYNIMNGRKSLVPLLERINTFFSSAKPFSLT